jgi:hypothetical protein
VTLASNMPSLNMNFGGASITVALAANGAITVTPAASGLVTRLGKRDGHHRATCA